MASIGRIVTVGLISLLFALGVDGQATTTAVCTLDPWRIQKVRAHAKWPPHYRQHVMAELSDYEIPAIPKGDLYIGPDVGYSNRCICSSVTYSMVSACGACQGASEIRWSNWIKNCTDTDITLGQYPLSIPPGISIPAWAFLNVTELNTWDPTASLTSHNSGNPDISATSKSKPKSSTNVAAIAGGAAGGVVFIIIIIGLIVFFMRRNRKAGVRMEQIAYPGAMQSPPPSVRPFYPNGTPPVLDQKPYDPSDASTFPKNLVPHHIGSASIPNSEPYTNGPPSQYLASSPYVQPDPYSMLSGAFGQPQTSQHQRGSYKPVGFLTGLLTYQPPTDQPPTYQSPTYQPPTYQPPTYQSPIYQPPTYQPPTYQPPTYQPPTYQPPTYQPPTYQSPTYQPPTYQPPTYQPPTYQPPTYQPPTY
ncbi:hypothetical protein BU17DRAFT_90880 [Hysterangium stoloniferum]|nr:hypothetical protein BU17DRAFT_90880 [Hysterangium stoloniferum]